MEIQRLVLALGKPWFFRALPACTRWLRGFVQIPSMLIGPVLLRSALFTERCERAFAFPIEVRWFRRALAAAEVLFPPRFAAGFALVVGIMK